MQIVRYLLGLRGLWGRRGLVQAVRWQWTNMRAALTLCRTLGVDSSFPQVLGGPLGSFFQNSFIHSFIYWRIVALHCSVNFCCTAKWISHLSIYLSIYVSVSLLDFLPICFTTEHWADFPVLYTRSLLIDFMCSISAVYMSTQVSQFIPAPRYCLSNVFLMMLKFASDSLRRVWWHLWSLFSRRDGSMLCGLCWGSLPGHLLEFSEVPLLD